MIIKFYVLYRDDAIKFLFHHFAHYLLDRLLLNCRVSKVCAPKGDKCPNRGWVILESWQSARPLSFTLERETRWNTVFSGFHILPSRKKLRQQVNC